MTGFGWALWILAVGGLLYLAKVSSDWLIHRAQRESDAVAFAEPREHFNCRCMLVWNQPPTTAAYERDRMLAAIAARQRTDVSPIDFDNLDDLSRML